MIIKKNRQNLGLIDQLIANIKKIKIRYFTILVLFTIFTTGVGTYGIYYGTKLNGSEKSSVFASFYRFFRPSLNIVSHYFKGIISKPEELSIHLNHIDYEKLAYRVENARKNGIISKEEKKEEVNGYIELNGNRYDIKLKLKGLYLDHLNGDKWSFRVKVKDDKTIFGVSRFSLHSPETRGHIHEWVFQKALKSEGLIHMRYNFVKIYLNGKYLGIYAFEEFFEKRLIENNKKREGIILKPDRIIDKEGNQANYNYNEKISNNTLYEPYVYQKQKVVSSPTLSNQYNNVKERLELFRYKKISINALVDLDLTAKYLSLTTIFGGQHGNVPENLIFYYNPITNLLEPIGYDGNVARNIKRYGGLITSPNNAYHNSIFIKSGLLTTLFNSNEFYKQYILELKRMTAENYISNFFNIIKDELNENLAILYKEYPYFDFFKRDFYSANINYVKKQLFDDSGVKVDFIHHESRDRINLKIDNLKDVPIDVVGLELSKGIKYKPNEKLIIKPTIIDEAKIVRFYKQDYSEPLRYENELKLVYNIHGLDSTFKIVVDNVPFIFWKNKKQAEKISNANSLKNQYSFLNIDTLTNTVIINSGIYKITSDLIIPKDHIFLLKAGVQLDLLNDSRIISYSPIRFLGTKAQPIIINSTDLTGQGISVINANEESILDNVFIDNLKNLSKNGWELMGAVNFYESDVKIINCVFRYNNSEDALNIIRSEYKIDNTSFSNIKSDAFDGDFSKGSISNSYFTYCGNDAIDISGGSVSIANVKINNIGDKGLSAGENSRLFGKNVIIKGSEIGVTSKDLSFVLLEKVEISNLKVGFTAFQKKPEFGPGNIEISDLEIYDTEVPFLIEKGSTMISENKKIEANNEKVEDILYGNVFGKSSK